MQQKALYNKVCFYKTKRAIALFVFILFIKNFNAQINLIPNPSFELNTGIPQNFFEINKCQNWYTAFGTPDYFSTSSPVINNMSQCSVNIPYNWTGYQQSKTGDFYTGICMRAFTPRVGYPAFSNYFEMLGVQLKQKLIKDHVYDFQLFYSLSNGSGFVSNQLSAYFSATQFTISGINFNLFDQNWYNTNINNVLPQINNDTSIFLNSDTLNWNKFEGCFIANGTEEFVTIGNFRDGKFNKIQSLGTNFNFPCPSESNSEKCFIYLDDVSLYDLGYYSGKANCKNDTVICFNSSISISNNIKDSSIIAWQPHPSLSCTNCPNPIATPTVTTKYYVTKTLCSFITKDSITITVITPSVSANAGINDTICLGKNARLGMADSTYFTNYIWQPNISLSCFNCSMPYANPISDITYTLQRSQCNVTNSSTVFVKVEDCAPIFTIPNIFTPNGDGVNDAWGVNFSNTQYIKNFQLNIFNRWGTPILQTPNESQKGNSKINLPSIKWDGHTTSGEACVDGIYFYIINFELNGEKQTFKGNVTLVR